MINKVNSKYTIFIVGILIVTFIFFFTIFKSKATRPILHHGSEGKNVAEVQEKLKELGYFKGEIDGEYDGETQTAVKEFQKDKGITASGLVKKETWEALGFSMVTYRSKRDYPVYRNDEITMLARLVHAEARGEPYMGQVAVASVVLNRVESPAFPNSISEVIFQPLQFESVANGQFNLEPNQENIKAARSAFNGWDPTQGALFFYNPDKPINPWILSRNIIREIKNHVFAQ